MCRYVFYRCVSVAWEIAVGSLWKASVCFVMGVCRLLGWLPLLLTFTMYPLFSSVPLLFSSILYYSMLFYSIPVWAVACGMCRSVFYRCVSVAWVVASFCLQSLSIFSSRLFSSFLVYSLISYSSIFEYGRLPVECVGILFIGVCRSLGRLLPVACGMCRYVFYRCVSVALGDCLVLLTTTVYLLFSPVLFFSRIFFNIIFLYIRV